MSLCCVWLRLGLVWGSEFVLFVREVCVGLWNEFVLCVGDIFVGFGIVCMCCVWDRLGRFWRSEFVLRVVEFCVNLGE